MKKLSCIISVLISIAVLSSFEQPFNLKASMERGKSVYLTYCMSCHMMEGQGVEGVFSPMAKNPNLAFKDKTIQIILKGIRGPVTVNNKTYPGDMAPVSLTDEQTSDLLNYIRNSWGNKGAPVLPKDIQPALKAVVKDYKAY